MANQLHDFHMQLLSLYQQEEQLLARLRNIREHKKTAVEMIQSIQKAEKVVAEQGAEANS